MLEGRFVPTFAAELISYPSEFSSRLRKTRRAKGKGKGTSSPRAAKSLKIDSRFSACGPHFACAKHFFLALSATCQQRSGLLFIKVARYRQQLLGNTQKLLRYTSRS